MNAQELFDYLIADGGLDQATVDQLKALAKNEKIATRAQTLKQQSELDAIEAQRQALAAELDGAPDKKLVGARVYKKWYDDNFSAVQALQQREARYRERYGDLDSPTTTTTSAPSGTLTREDLEKLWQEKFSSITPMMSGVMTSQAKVIERHLRAGRKKDIDWDAVSKAAAAKGGDLVAGYEEWDKPEAEAAAKAAEDARVDARVKAEIAKRQSAQFFPGAADATPASERSPLSRGLAVVDKPVYDRSKVIQAAVTGKYAPDEGAA